MLMAAATSSWSSAQAGSAMPQTSKVATEQPIFFFISPSPVPIPIAGRHF